MEHVGDENTTLPILYFDPGSFFSQIALLGLHEKQAKFIPGFVNIAKAEHLKPCFLHMNPAAQVPVMKDGENTIIGSDKILLHLDQNFSHDASSRLLPLKDSEKILKYDQLFRSIPNAVLTMGLLFCPELSLEVKIPEYEKVQRKGLLNNFDELLDNAEKAHSDPPEIFKNKRKMLGHFKQIVTNKEEVKKAIEATRAVLGQVETELSTHTKDHEDWWLCCEHFSIADVYLAVLLHRLDLLGQSTNLLSPESRPNLIKYKERVVRRPTFQAFVADVHRLHREFETSISK